MLKGLLTPAIGYVAAGSILIGAIGGWTVRDYKADADIAKIERQLREAQDKQRALADKASSEYERGKAERTTATQRTQDKIREVYRDIEVPADCEPPGDALRLLDEAIASGRNPG